MKKLALVFSLLILMGGAVAQAQCPPVVQATGASVRPDELTRAYITPVRVVMKYGGRHGDLLRGDSLLLRPGNGQAQSGRKNCAVMRSTPEEKPFLLLDFGCELHGGLHLVLGGSSRREPSKVRIRFGESVEEANSETCNSEWKRGFSTDDHAKRDFVMEIPRDGSIELGNTGFRFVRIDLLEEEATISLKEVSAILRYRDIPYLGSFSCSDERLNRIWATGAYTVHLNMQEFLWDGIKRDRLVWLGDMHPEMTTITRVFGAHEIVPRSIDLACEQYPLPRWLNNMSAYSMWYLVIMRDWYQQTGNVDYVRRHADYIAGVVALVDKKVDEQGNESLASWRFLDWPSSPDTLGVEAGYRALIIWAMNDASELLTLIGRDNDAALCHDIVFRLEKKSLPHNHLKQAAALMALAGLLDPVQACKEVVAVGGAERFSTFYGYYMLEALAMAHMYETALDIIRDYWGGMLDMGATTFWEDFNLDWTVGAAPIDNPVPEGMKDIHGDFGDYCYPGFRHSLCHGWASGPTAWLSDHVLGVSIVDPVKRWVSIEPHLGDLLWAKGSYPTPWGVIEVSHERLDNGKIKSSVKLPRGVHRVK